MISQAAMDEIRALVEGDRWRKMTDADKLRQVIDMLGNGFFPQPYQRAWMIDLASRLENTQSQFPAMRPDYWD
jgi:hypothetical protein